MKEDELRALLGGLRPELRTIVWALRRVVRRTIPEAEESQLWGGLSYHRPEVGGRVKGSVCQINLKGGQVRLEFIHGIRLSDPMRLLQGNLISKRFITIESSSAAERPEVIALIRQAAGLDPTQFMLLD